MSQDSYNPLHSAVARGGVMARLVEFLKLEAAGGMVLVIAAVMAILIANSPFGGLYHYILNDLHFEVGFHDTEGLGAFTLNKSVLHWINDGLMAVFFFLVGLEIKREFMEGQLSSRARALLPFIGAAGGMILPAVIFYGLTFHDAQMVRGWAIPSATDIAFTLGVLALLGPRVPFSLKVLVTAIAVIDDLGAILIIALFYSHGLYLPALVVAGGALTLMILCNRALGIVRPAIYVLIGFILWAAVLKSGVHATLAGVITALCIPMASVRNPSYRPCERLIDTLHPWVAFLILPLFAFANAGVSFAGMAVGAVASPVVMGIAIGLFAGKQIGIFAAVWAAIRSGLCVRPEGASWVQIYGVAILCGIGFTMSLFIGGLAYTDLALQVDVRLGVIIGSVLSAVFGYIVLHRTGQVERRNRPH